MGSMLVAWAIERVVKGYLVHEWLGVFLFVQ